MMKGRIFFRKEKNLQFLFQNVSKKEEKTENAPERTYITINSGKDTNAADDSVKKEETKDSEETACPEPTDEKDSVKEENVPEEKTSSVVVEDDTEEGKTE